MASPTTGLLTPVNFARESVARESIADAQQTRSDGKSGLIDQLFMGASRGNLIEGNVGTRGVDSVDRHVFESSAAASGIARYQARPARTWRD